MKWSLRPPLVLTPFDCLHAQEGPLPRLELCLVWSSMAMVVGQSLGSELVPRFSHFRLRRRAGADYIPPSVRVPQPLS